MPKAAPKVVTKRSTRAHPSPNGFRELPPPTKTTRNVTPYEHAVHKRRRVPEPKASPPAAAAQANSSEDVGNTYYHHSTPTPTSRSQSPHVAESHSPSADPESRSTSPPIQETTQPIRNTTRTLRSATRSISPNAQVASVQRPRTRPASSTVTAKKAAAGQKRNQPEPDTSDDENVIKSNHNTPVEKRGNKRARTEAHGVDADLEALFAPTPEQVVAASKNDSSADDGSVQPVQPLTISRSRSSSRPVASIIEHNSEDAGSEDSSSDAHRPADGRKRLGPRSAIYSAARSSDEKMPDDMSVRQKIAMEEFGVKIPRLPQTIDGLHYSNGQVFEESYVEDDENDIDVWGSGKFSVAENRKVLLESRELIAKAKKIKSAPTTPRSKDAFQAGKQSVTKAQTVAKAQSSRPSTISNFINSVASLNNPTNSLQITSCSSSSTSSPLILTDGPLLETARALVNYAEENPASRLPTGAEMKVLLAEFAAREQNNENHHAAASDAATESPQSDIRQAIDEHPSDAQEKASPVTQNATNDGEVAKELSSPQTPIPETPFQPTKSRGWFSGIASVAKSVASTPFSVFGRRSHSAESPSTNVTSVVDGAANAHLLPKTSDFAVPPTPVNPKIIRRPQTEYKPRSCIKPRVSPNARDVPQTDKRVRFWVPIEKRGALTPEQVAAIHRKEDEDANLQARQDHRARLHPSVEEADEFDDFPKLGGKRKRKSSVERPADFNWSGHFEMPDFPSSPEAEESDSEPEHSTPSRQSSIGNIFMQADQASKTDSTPTPKRFGDTLKRLLATASNLSGESQASVDLSPIATVGEKPIESTQALSRTKATTSKYGIGSPFGAPVGASLFPPPDITPAAFRASTKLLAAPTTPSYAGTPFGAPKGSTLFPASTSSTTPKYPASAPARKLSDLTANSTDASGTHGHSSHYGSHTQKREADVPIIRPFGKNDHDISERRAELLRKYRGPLPPSINPSSVTRNPLRGDDVFDSSTNSSLTSNPLSQSMNSAWSRSTLHRDAFGTPVKSFRRTGRPRTGARSGIISVEARIVEPKPVEEDPKPAIVQNPFLVSSAATPSNEPFSSTPGYNPSSPENLSKIFGKSSATPAAIPAANSGGLFDRITAPAGDSRIGNLAAGAHTGEHAAEGTAGQSSPGHTFGFTYDSATEGDSSLIGDTSFNGDENANQADGPQITENATTTPLQQRAWTQTPPPKPKPSNAQLPQAPTQPSAADIAKARAEKYKPTVPSKLSQSTVMTPPSHHNKENTNPETEIVEQMKAALRAEMQADMNLFAPEIRAAAEEAIIVEEKKQALRTEMQHDRNLFSAEVWAAVDRYF